MASRFELPHADAGFNPAAESAADGERFPQEAEVKAEEEGLQAEQQSALF